MIDLIEISWPKGVRILLKLFALVSSGSCGRFKKRREFDGEEMEEEAMDMLDSDRLSRSKGGDDMEMDLSLEERVLLPPDGILGRVSALFREREPKCEFILWEKKEGD